jgi:uracil-DNA glycosylase
VKPLLVGEQPSRSGDRYYMTPLSGAVAQTLCQMAGIPPQEEGSRYGVWTWALYENFSCLNAMERHQPWDSQKAAAHLREEIESDDEVVVLLGRRAQSAYCAMNQPAETTIAKLHFYQWRVDLSSPTARREVVVIPHPSSLNRMYENPRDRERAGKILRQAMEKAAQLYETRL